MRRLLRLASAASLVGFLITTLLSPERTAKRQQRKAETARKSSAPTAQSIARDLLDQDLEEDELFEAMWTWQYTAGIEPSSIYQEYKQLREHQPEEHHP